MPERGEFFITDGYGSVKPPKSEAAPLERQRYLKIEGMNSRFLSSSNSGCFDGAISQTDLAIPVS
jgi:hypothetical protein